MAFTEELYLNFSPYDQVADAEIKLENLVMKDNHKATQLFVEFYRLASILQYNDSALPKRIKDEMVHFDKPRTLDDLQDLIQKIDQRYWERHGELSRETHSAPKPEAKTTGIAVPFVSDQIQGHGIVLPDHFTEAEHREFEDPENYAQFRHEIEEELDDQ
ncbi:hypothetical protein JB92DRAFT_3111437 [Gautieria morchelliformis]|nr:hypothetical protein JB92DRAFT_3111437 [Gautieria morchelliformis]